jgi:UDP-GlcNAc:undecaprenyl-phosphate GlcNAc-1-phosphate transferase
MALSHDTLAANLFPGLIALVSALVITPLVIKLAYKRQWVVYPRSDRWHKNPTALMGGIGIFAAYSIGIFWLGFSRVNWMLYTASGLMFATGLLDDLVEIKPVYKILAQVTCSFVMIYHGLTFGGGLLGWAGIPLTFIWVIGITNAINLLDNMDGLSAGISAVIAVIAGILGFLNANYSFAMMSFTLAGAAIGFLVYNFKPAKIFMGDCGSLFLGFSLSFLSVGVQRDFGSSSALLVLFVPLSLMAIPIMDTTLVTIKRLLAGRRIDQGGKDHTSHRLVALGLSEKRAVLILYAISLVWGVLCIMMYRVKINNLFLCILLLAIFSVIFSVFLSKVKVYNESEEKLTYLLTRGHKTEKNLLMRFFLFHKKFLIGLCTDILVIFCSFLIARKATRLGVEEDHLVLATFICVKLIIFYISNLYYRMWRYVEVVELAGYFLFMLLSSILLVVILYLKGKHAYSPYFFLVDFLVTFTGVIFSRMLFRWLNEVVSRNRDTEKRVIIYGAGDSGYLLIKELLQNHRHDLRPVGWIDDDPAKHNMFLYGSKIYGGKDELLRVCRTTGANMVLISSESIDHDAEQELRVLLRSESVEVGRFSMSISFGGLSHLPEA